MEPTGPEEPTAYTQGFQEGFSLSERQHTDLILQLKEEMRGLLLAMQELLDSNAEAEGTDPDSLYQLNARLSTIRRARTALDEARRGGII